MPQLAQCLIALLGIRRQVLSAGGHPMQLVRTIWPISLLGLLSPCCLLCLNQGSEQSSLQRASSGKIPASEVERGFALGMQTRFDLQWPDMQHILGRLCRVPAGIDECMLLIECFGSRHFALHETAIRAILDSPCNCHAMTFGLALERTDCLGADMLSCHSTSLTNTSALALLALCHQV